MDQLLKQVFDVKFSLKNYYSNNNADGNRTEQNKSVQNIKRLYEQMQMESC